MGAMSDLLELATDWWSEYARRVLERQSSPLTDADVAKRKERRTVKRDELGRAIRTDDDPAETIGVWFV